MKYRIRAALAGIVLLASPLAAQKPPTAAPTAPAESRWLPLAGPALASFLVGRWTDDNNCSNVIDIRGDGSFVTTAGASGRWSVTDVALTFSAQRHITSLVRAPDQRTIELVHQDGSVGRSTRC